MTDFKRNDKRKTAADIMKKHWDAHVSKGVPFIAADVTKEIRETLGLHKTNAALEVVDSGEGAARSYVTYLCKCFTGVSKSVNDKLDPKYKDYIPGLTIEHFDYVRKDRAKPAPKNTTIEKPALDPKTKTDRLATIKAAAAKRSSPKNKATKRIEELAAAGAHHALAETEPSKVVEPA